MRTDPLSLSDVLVTVPSGRGAEAGAAYTALLGDPVSEVRWPAANGSLVLGGDEAWAAFEAADLAAAAQLAARRGVSFDEASGPDGARRATEVPAIGLTASAGSVAGRPALDHVVFTAPSVDAAVALFAGRLGLDLRLERAFGGLTQMFFRTRSVIVEVLAGGEAAPEFALWGLAWRCADLDAEHARLTGLGLTLSEVRAGRKPGTRVTTVREPSLGTPTILIEQTAR
ncbi:VOC family protein [Gordonia iterans]